MDDLNVLPEPLTHASCDLRDFPFMPLMVAQFRDSDLAADETPEVCWAAMLIQAASWHQLPAGSIPDDDNWIAKTANYRMRGKTDRAWKRVRPGALHGWIKCSDGRLYHPDVAKKANDAWDSKLKQRYRTECARLAKMDPPAPKPDYDVWLANGAPVGRDGDKLLNLQGIQGMQPKDGEETRNDHPKDGKETQKPHPLDIQGEVEVEVEGILKAYTTGTSPVVPRAQAHATPSATPPVDNSIGTTGLANSRPEDHPEDVKNAEPQPPKDVLKIASDGAVPAPKEAEDAAMATSSVPAKPDKPPTAGRKKSELAQRFVGVDDVIAKGAERQYALDWMAVRKAKGCGLTASELEANEREAAKAGISFGQAVQTCAENGWRGFKENYWRNLQARILPAVRASPYPENLPDGVIPLVRSSTMQSAEIAKKLIFRQSAQQANEGRM